MKRTLAALFLSQMLAGAALAQEPAASSEFGRVSGGQLEVAVKSPATSSGSLGLMSGSGVSGYEATLGGTLVNDRLWFFAAASHAEMPERAVSGMVDAKLTAQIGDRQNLAASFSTGRQPVTTAPTMAGNPIPSSFLSLRYDGIVSSNLFFSATFSKRSVAPPSPFTDR